MGDVKISSSIRTQIESVFGNAIFDRPLFYCYPGGLRIELSSGGTAISQFITALSKSKEVCEEIFKSEQNIIVCLRSYTTSITHLLSSIRSLKNAGLLLPHDREHWLYYPENGDDDASRMICFSLDKDQLTSLLWCACAVDFGCIQPNPGFSCYLFNPGLGVAAYPYDDRGMDVVGPNHLFLKGLYNRYQSYLLGYDLQTMNETFMRC